MLDYANKARCALQRGVMQRAKYAKRTKYVMRGTCSVCAKCNVFAATAALTLLLQCWIWSKWLFLGSPSIYQHDHSDRPLIAAILVALGFFVGASGPVLDAAQLFRETAAVIKSAFKQIIESK